MPITLNFRSFHPRLSSVDYVCIHPLLGPYCTKAKNVLAKYQLDPSKVEILEIEKRPDCSEIQSYLKDLTGASSVPRVFIGGQFIGGGDDTAAKDASGQLLPLLQQASALQ